ncbi:MAG: Uma2 family endonuclease [Vulcanimicrobiota bacterium]
MSFPVKKEQQRYTYGDYLSWPEGERWELIDGVPNDITPSPSADHQRILRDLSMHFSVYLKDRSCEVFFAPFDVRLPHGDEKDEDVPTLVQPDLIVACDKSKLDEKGCRGAPDLIVEVLSPSTARKDMKEKRDLYERSGVREYWLVHPGDRTISVFLLSVDGIYGKPEVYGDKDEIKVFVLDDLRIDLRTVFPLQTSH